MDSRVRFSTALEAITSDTDFYHPDEYKQLLSDLELPAKPEGNSVLLVTARCHQALIQHRASQFYLNILNKIQATQEISIYEYLYYVLATANITTLNVPSLTDLYDHLLEGDQNQYGGIEQIIATILLARKYTAAGEEQNQAAMTELIEALHADRAYYLNLMGVELPKLQLKAAYLYFIDFSAANLTGLQAQQVALAGCNFTRARLDHATVTISSAYGLVLKQASITHADIQFQNSQSILLPDSNLEGSLFKFEHCDELDFCNANMTETKLYLPLDAKNISLLNVKLYLASDSLLNFANLSGCELLSTEQIHDEKSMQDSLWRNKNFAANCLYHLQQSYPLHTNDDFMRKQNHLFQIQLATAVVSLLQSNKYDNQEKLALLKVAMRHPAFCLNESSTNDDLAEQIFSYAGKVANSVFTLFSGSNNSRVDCDSDLLGEFDYDSPMNSEAIAILQELFSKIEILVNSNTENKLQYLM